MDICVRCATSQDIEFLASRLRRADVEEIQAASGLKPLAALELGFKHSRFTLVGTKDGVPFCIFGVADSPIEGEGSIWMVGTPDIRRVGKSVCRLARRHISGFLKLWPTLRNFADERNTTHLDWLRFMGAQFHRRVKYGVEGRYFREFSFSCAIP